MQPLKERATQLSEELNSAIEQVNLKDLQEEKNKLQAESEKQNFWEKSEEAQSTMQEIAKLERRIQPWQDIQTDLEDLIHLIDLEDSYLEADLSEQLSLVEKQFNTLKTQLKFMGPYDDHDTILSIFAGAGGTDAQDWTQMLLRMYVRWAEAHHCKVTTLTESAGDEAGLKSVTVELQGDFMYAKLKGEHGVHRLVRLSPFNANHLRETSFSKVEVFPRVDKPTDLVIDEKDLKIDVYRSGGHGGQSVNTTDSAVRVTHIPTGITIAIQNERSQLQNKETALTLLRSKLVQLELEQHKDNIRELKGPNQSAEWGNQIRSYVLHPYKQVKDLRTGYETSDADGVLDGKIDPLIDAYLEMNIQA